MREFVIEQDGEFALPLNGFVCSDLGRYGFLDIVDESGAEARILLLREEHKALAAALVERRARVERAFFTGDSELRLIFDGGDTIVVPPDGKYEAWEVRIGRNGDVGVFATPGGGEPSVWGAIWIRANERG
jgi:hypothetical protein